jgi:glutathionyl-hydroquinone reductase
MWSMGFRRCGFATSQEGYETVFDTLLAALDRNSGLSEKAALILPANSR